MQSFAARQNRKKRNAREDSDASDDQEPARKVNDLQSSTNKTNMKMENAVRASRIEVWEGLDKPMQEAPTVGAASDDANLSVMLASLALGGGKFIDGKYGSLELVDKGLEGFVGLPDVHTFEAIRREHASTEMFTPSNKQGTPPLPPTP